MPNGKLSEEFKSVADHRLFRSIFGIENPSDLFEKKFIVKINFQKGGFIGGHDEVHFFFGTIRGLDLNLYNCEIRIFADPAVLDGLAVDYIRFFLHHWDQSIGCEIVFKNSAPRFSADFELIE